MWTGRGIDGLRPLSCLGVTPHNCPILIRVSCPFLSDGVQVGGTALGNASIDRGTVRGGGVIPEAVVVLRRVVELSVLMVVYTSEQGILEIERITIITTSAKY